MIVQCTKHRRIAEVARSRPLDCPNRSPVQHYFAKRAFRCSAPRPPGTLCQEQLLTSDNDSLGTFKSRLKTFLFSLAFNWHWHYRRQRLWSYDLTAQYKSIIIIIIIIIIWHSNAVIQEVLAENGFWHEIATQGHSMSFILQSVTGRQG